MEKEFIIFHGLFGLSKETGIFKKITKLIKEKINGIFNMPEDVILRLIRVHTHIKLREINKKITSDVNNRIISDVNIRRKKL